MSNRIENPYIEGGIWLRGNLHTHTSNSDGPLSPQETIYRYAELGYDFIMLSDHDRVTSFKGLDLAGLILISGNEITAGGPHMLHVGTVEPIAPDPDRQKVLDKIASNGGFAVMCHPNWESGFNHCPQPSLERWKGYTGIEIFNGVCTWVEGSPYATDRWDMLLSKGRRVWGFADDDCHVPTDLGVAWNVVRCTERSATAVLDGLKHGSFYASTGIAIETIEVRDMAIRVKAPGASRIAVYSDHACRPAFTDSDEIVFTIPEQPSFSYVRFECIGRADQRAWTQPFFLGPAAET